MKYLRLLLSIFVIFTFIGCTLPPSQVIFKNHTNQVVEIRVHLNFDTTTTLYYADYYWINKLIPSSKFKTTKYTKSSKTEWRNARLGVISLQPNSTTHVVVPRIAAIVNSITLNYHNGHIDTLNKNMKYEVFSKSGEKRTYARPYSQDFMVYDIKSKQPKKENSQLIQMDTIALYQLVQALHLDNKESNTYYPLNHLGNFDFTSLTKADHEMLLILLEQNNVASRYVHSLLSSQSSINCDATISDHFTYFMKCYMTNEKYPGNNPIICPDYSKGQAFKEEIKKWLQYKIETWE